MKYLKNIRVALAILLFLPIFLYLIDFTGKLPVQMHALLKIQWIPALLSLNLIIIALLVVISLLFGRIYCSTICPLGIFQDCLLYTSPSPRDRQKSRMPSSA